MFRIAVIGSGATAVSIVEAALNSSIEVEVSIFDPWIQLSQTRQPKEKLTAGQFAKKSRFGSLAMYEYPAKYICVDEGLHVPLSGTVGGLTTVWGANSTVPESSDLELYTSEYTQESIDWVKKYTSITSLGEIKDDTNFYISKRLGFLLNADTHTNANGLSTTPASLAFNSKNCTSVGGCLKGCAQNAIFSADYQIPELLQKPNVELNKGFVRRIQVLTDGKFSLELEVENKVMVSSKQFDKVFIACGAIASCALLQRSGLLQDEVHLHDTQVFYSAFFVWKSIAPATTTFELAQIFIRKPQQLHISLYEYSNQFIERARLILGFAVNFVPKYIWNHVIAGIGFIDSSNSGILRLRYSNSVTRISQTSNVHSQKNIRHLMKLVRRQLNGTGIVHIPFLNQIPNVGASYHIGAASYQDRPLFTAQGKLVSSEHLELYVLDSGSLKTLPVGPITTTVMASAYGRTKLALENE